MYIPTLKELDAVWMKSYKPWEWRIRLNYDLYVSFFKEENIWSVWEDEYAMINFYPENVDQVKTMLLLLTNIK